MKHHKLLGTDRCRAAVSLIQRQIGILTLRTAVSCKSHLLAEPMRQIEFSRRTHTSQGLSWLASYALLILCYSREICLEIILLLLVQVVASFNNLASTTTRRFRARERGTQRDFSAPSCCLLSHAASSVAQARTLLCARHPGIETFASSSPSANSLRLLILNLLIPHLARYPSADFRCLLSQQITTHYPNPYHHPK